MTIDEIKWTTQTNGERFAFVGDYTIIEKDERTIDAPYKTSLIAYDVYEDIDGDSCHVGRYSLDALLKVIA